MSVLDYSNMFKSNNNDYAEENSFDDRELDFQGSTSMPNIEYQSSDATTWVINNMKSLNIECDESDMNENVINILQKLFVERNHFQSQCQMLASTCSKLKGGMSTATKERDYANTQIEMLKQDINTANNKITALKNEHRELKCQWLSEKSDLETRCFQTQALHTQLQGTLRKKEKDYDKLQQQLLKINKDSQRGSKSTIVISKPLSRNLEQSNKESGSLHNAEIQSCKSTIKSLEIENSNLRDAIEDLTVTFEAFQSRMTNALLEKEKAVNSTIANYNNNKENIENGILNDNSIEFHQMTSIQQAKYVEKKLDDTCAKLTDVALGVSNRANISDILNKGNSTENNELKTPTKDASNVPFVSKTPSYARSGIKNISSALKSVGVPGTPAARPFNWLVKQAASEVKLLRQRTEQLYLVEIDKENVQNGGNSQLTENDASIANSNMNIHEYKRQLQEALQVIYEQDRLIHAALLGKLPYHNTSRVLNETTNTNNNDYFTSPIYVEEEEDEMEDEFEDKFCMDALDNKGATLTPMNIMDTSYDPSNWSIGEFLPPVSPETMEVLQASGISHLARAAKPEKLYLDENLY